MANHGSTGETQPMRQEILITARSLFIQQGYRGLSMSMLARAVGVSKAALYYHFKDKEELFLAVLNELLDELDFMIQQVILESNDSRLRIGSLISRIMAWPPEQRATIRLASQELSQISHPASQNFHQVYYEIFVGKIQAIIQTGIQVGELRKVDPTLATWALLGIMYPYFNYTQSPESSPPDALAKQLVVIFLTGLEQSSREPR